jgi:hypothetical protein
MLRRCREDVCSSCRDDDRLGPSAVVVVGYRVFVEIGAHLLGRAANRSDRLGQALPADAEFLRPVVDLVVLGKADQVAVLRRPLRFVVGHDERVAYGEIEGVMVAAGRYYNRAAIQIRSELYGLVWCILSKNLIEKFGEGHSLSDVWDGKTVGVEGKLYYSAGARLTRIEAQERALAPIPLNC